MKIDIVKLNSDAIIPQIGTKFSAGCDLYACLENESVEIKPHETYMVNIGIAIKIPNGYYAAIFARSGIASKRNLRPANCVGVIDSDYRGEIRVPIHNDSNNVQTIENHERIAQMIIMKYEQIYFNEVEKLDETSRDLNGFGSTGTK